MAEFKVHFRLHSETLCLINQKKKKKHISYPQRIHTVTSRALSKAILSRGHLHTCLGWGRLSCSCADAGDVVMSHHGRNQMPGAVMSLIHLLGPGGRKPRAAPFHTRRYMIKPKEAWCLPGTLWVALGWGFWLQGLGWRGHCVPFPSF